MLKQTLFSLALHIKKILRLALTAHEHYQNGQLFFKSKSSLTVTVIDIVLVHIYLGKLFKFIHSLPIHYFECLSKMLVLIQLLKA